MWPGITVMSPSVPGTITASTSADISRRSGETSSNESVSAMMVLSGGCYQAASAAMRSALATASWMLPTM